MTWLSTRRRKPRCAACRCRYWSRDTGQCVRWQRNASHYTNASAPYQVYAITMATVPVCSHDAVNDPEIKCDVSSPTNVRQALNGKDGFCGLNELLFIISIWLMSSINPLTPTVAIWLQVLKHPVPDRVKPSFVIFDIRALWRSGLTHTDVYCNVSANAVG